jgi:hypothetical protein
MEFVVFCSGGGALYYGVHVIRCHILVPGLFEGDAWICFASGAFLTVVSFTQGGHECSQTTGFKLWTYCLANIVFVPANINSCRATYKTHHTTLRIFSLFVNFLIELMFVIYGRIVLFHPGPCARFKREARRLWIWGQFAYYIKILSVVFIGISIVGLFAYYFYKHIMHHFSPHDMEFGNIPMAEVELRSNELQVEFVENNPEVCGLLWILKFFCQ